MPKPETIIAEIYDAWRAQGLEWLASYLPDDFCHIICVPQDIHPLGSVCRGGSDPIERTRGSRTAARSFRRAYPSARG
jgi:hypothetical protein